MKLNQFKFWQYGIAITLTIVAIATYNLTVADKSLFIAGEPSHGHHQIELACTSCHSNGFADDSSMQNACMTCHGDDLELSNDSHPRKKFLDPRNAALLSHLDARQCVSCHTEHKPEITREMGVTLAGDFCFHCHQDIAENRTSHKGLPFDSCASAGCHNFHDNRNLYEDFLISHINQPDLLETPGLPALTALQSWLQQHPQKKALQAAHADLSELSNQQVIEDWSASIHAQVAVNCSDCHTDGQQQFSSREIVAQCGNCHSEQQQAFTGGKHGMRLSSKLPETFASHTQAMSPRLAQIPMKDDANSELNCTSCHSAHKPDPVFAAVEACLGCHSDEHSIAYKNSAHFKLWSPSNEQQTNTGVSCANCHLPREQHKGQVLVNHNQNHNLRPNDKMLPVCLNCHGAEFALSALADEKLITSNFNDQPTQQHKTFSLIRDRLATIQSRQQ